MSDLWPSDRVNRQFARWVLSGVQILLMVLIALGLLDLLYLLVRGVWTKFTSIASVGELQHGMQHGFAGILLILIGLELIETVRAYLHDHHVRLEIVLIVAMIAVGRHILEIDLQEAEGITLIGIAALTLALTIGFFITRQRPMSSAGPGTIHQPADPTERSQ